MAPSSKGANPAPDYAVAMNRVQTQIEAQLRAVRSFMPPRAPPQAASPCSSSSTRPTPSFSALASASASASTLPRPAASNSASRQRTQSQDGESLFAETRAQDPNAGLGFGASSKKRGSEQARAREDQLLRSRLLGGRKRGAEDRTLRRGTREGGSSDEEAGRSGLGRAKKRARRAESQEKAEDDGDGDEARGREETIQPVIAPEVVGSAGLDKVGSTQLRDDGLRNDELEAEEGENGDVDIDIRGAYGVASLHEDLVRDGAEDASEQKMKKRRKRKKRNKDKSKERKGE
ncbi:hypothetical protein F4824DRAFT_452763 [Ustulina deusta]|nr:hypothetical protein F4824DRAFT_452763 [Ustulina deusta]